MLDAVSIPAILCSVLLLCSHSLLSHGKFRACPSRQWRCSCSYSDLLPCVSKCTWTHFKNSHKCSPCFIWLRTWPSTKTPKVLNHQELHKAWLITCQGKGSKQPSKRKEWKRRKRRKSEEPSPGNRAGLAQSSHAKSVGDALLAKWAEGHQWQGHQLSSTHQYFVSFKVSVLFINFTCEWLTDLATTFTPLPELLPQFLSKPLSVFYFEHHNSDKLLQFYPTPHLPCHFLFSFIYPKKYFPPFISEPFPSV